LIHERIVRRVRDDSVYIEALLTRRGIRSVPQAGTHVARRLAPDQVDEQQVFRMTGGIMSKELLVSWLQDAHAMESALPPVLRTHASHAKDVIPEVSRRQEAHARETEQHAERMRQALERLGAKPSLMKSALSAMMGPVQGVSTGLFSDALVKDALADDATERFEVACYTALIAAADDLGEIEITSLCRENLVEDEAMAQWLEEQLPTVVRRTLHARSGAS
jgi:ferritin-like metal-binding protein YciE